jgi:hypothetical protein
LKVLDTAFLKTTKDQALRLAPQVTFSFGWQAYLGKQAVPGSNPRSTT